MIAEDDKRVSSQLWAHWRSHGPMFTEFTTKEPRMMHYKHSKGADLDVVYTLDLNFAQDRGVTFNQIGSIAILLKNTMPSEALVRIVKSLKKELGVIILFGTRSPQFTEGSRTYSSIGTQEDPVQQYMEPARGKPTRPHMETVRVNLLGKSSDQGSPSARRSRSVDRRRREETFADEVIDGTCS